MGPLMPEGLESRLRQVDPNVDVVHVPYFESNELRTSKGLNAGKDPQGLPVPELSEQDRANLARAHGVVSLDLPDGIAEAPRMTPHGLFVISGEPTPTCVGRSVGEPNPSSAVLGASTQPS